MPSSLNPWFPWYLLRPCWLLWTTDILGMRFYRKLVPLLFGNTELSSRSFACFNKWPTVLFKEKNLFCFIKYAENITNVFCCVTCFLQTEDLDSSCTYTQWNQFPSKMLLPVLLLIILKSFATHTRARSHTHTQGGLQRRITVGSLCTKYIIRANTLHNADPLNLI